LKNDILYTNYIDFEVRNGQFNWNQGKLLLSGNQMKCSELNMEFINSPLVMKTGKSGLHIRDDRIELEDYVIQIKNLKNDFISIGKNTMKIDSGSIVLKSGRFYNECFTLDQNMIRIQQAQQKIQQNDIYYEDSLLNLDSNSRIKLGDWEIKLDGDGLKIVNNKTELSLRQNRVDMIVGGQVVSIGGFDKGGEVIVESGGFRIQKREEDVYLQNSGKIYMKTNEPGIWSDAIKEINNEKYVDQMKLNSMMIEAIEKLRN
jgi:hypothetical protein